MNTLPRDKCTDLGSICYRNFHPKLYQDSEKFKNKLPINTHAETSAEPTNLRNGI